MNGQNYDLYDADVVAQRLSKVKDPALTYEQRVAYQKRKYEELLQKISFRDNHLKAEDRRYDYPDDFKPFVFFFKFLAKRPDAEPPGNINRLKLWLPDTILTAEGDNAPMWLYTSQDGYVHRTDNFTAKNITNKLGSFASPDELVAVIKKPQVRDFAFVGNDIRLLTLKDLSVVSQSILSNKGDMICLQRFVKSIGPKAFVCRTCWRRDRNPYVWVITNNKDFYSKSDKISDTQKYITNPRAMNSCTILNSIRGRYVDETTPYIANLVKYVEHNVPGARFEEFIADFVKDESGTWWLVNVKGFVLVDKINVNPKVFLGSPDEVDVPVVHRTKKPEGYQKVAICKYCEGSYTVDELQHTMTLKSIIQTDKHLLHRGKTFKWLDRSEIKQIETGTLYQEHKVCRSCYKLHQETEKLRQVEFDLARALGVPVSEDKRPDLVSAIVFSAPPEPPASAMPVQDQPQSATKREMGRSLSKSNLSRISLDTPMHATKGQSNKYLKRYRLMLYLHMLYDIPKDIDANKQYHIEYGVLDQKQRYKVELNSAFSINGDILIPINKLRVFYFFSHDRKGVNEFINEQKVITFSLFCENEKIGSSNFELGDFLSDKVIKREIFKVFSGKTLPILSWGLKVTMGLIESGIEDGSRVPLAEHKNVYITYPEYYSSDALPEEWLQTYEETYQHVSNLLLKSELKSTMYSINTSRLDSSRKHRKSSFLKISGTYTPVKEQKDKIDFIQTPGLQITMNSYQKSLFADEKNLSARQTEEQNDEDLDVLRKILTDSIKDYEHKGLQRGKSASAHKRKFKGVREEAGHSSARTWGSAIKQIN